MRSGRHYAGSALAAVLLLTAGFLACSSFSSEPAPFVEPVPVFEDAGPPAEAGPPGTQDAAVLACERKVFGFETSLVGDGWNEVRKLGMGMMTIATDPNDPTSHAALASTLAADSEDVAYLYLRIPDRDRIEKLTVSAKLKQTVGGVDEPWVLGMWIQDGNSLLGGVRLRRTQTDQGSVQIFNQNLGPSQEVGTAEIGSFVQGQVSEAVFTFDGAWTTGEPGPRVTYAGRGRAPVGDLVRNVISSTDAGSHDLYLLVGRIYDSTVDSALEIDDIVVETCRRPL